MLKGNHNDLQCIHVALVLHVLYCERYLLIGECLGHISSSHNALVLAEAAVPATLAASVSILHLSCNSSHHRLCIISCPISAVAGFQLPLLYIQ